MPTWFVPTLKWDGIALAMVSVVGLIYEQMAPASETAEAVSEAPTNAVLDPAGEHPHGV